MNLSTTIKSIQDIMRRDDGVDGDAQRLGQLTWMLFLKVFDQREEEWEADATAYVSPIPDQYRWRNWAAYKPDSAGKKQPQIAPNELIPFVTKLFNALKAIDTSAGEPQQVIKSVFEDAHNYMKSGSLMLLVIEKLEEAINFHDFKTRSQLGDVYEQLLNDLRGAGNAGEFYTPRAITQFMVERVNPSLSKREKVLDPACGTGGFLTAAIDYFRHQLDNNPRSRARQKKLIEKLIKGIEKKQLPHLLCTTNMLLHGIDVPSQIEHRNTLGRSWNDWQRDEQVDCVITNPPFGGYEDDKVGSDYPDDLRTRETADMFMQLIVKRLLKDGGRAAVVLPDGFLFGDGVKAKLKEILLRQCRLHTIVRLPNGVFAPYTGIKTNLLFFTKSRKRTSGSEHFETDTIWFYEHPFPDGYKSYSKTKPIRPQEFDAERTWWGSEEDDFAAREPNAHAWKYEFGVKRREAVAAAAPYWQRAEVLEREISALEAEASDLRASLANIAKTSARRDAEARLAELRARLELLRLQASDARATADRLYWPIYNLDQKNPNAPADESEDPDVLLEEYETLLGQIEETENQLKSELAAALAHHVVGTGA